MMRTCLLAGAFAALAACASTEAQTAGTPPPDRDCFRSANISGHRVIDENHLEISAGSRKYIVTVRGNATDLNGPDPMLVDTTNGFICTGNGLGVNLSATNPRRPLFITEIARAPEMPPAAS